MRQAPDAVGVRVGTAVGLDRAAVYERQRWDEPRSMGSVRWSAVGLELTLGQSLNSSKELLIIFL